MAKTADVIVIGADMAAAGPPALMRGRRPAMTHCQVITVSIHPGRPGRRRGPCGLYANFGRAAASCSTVASSTLLIPQSQQQARPFPCHDSNLYSSSCISRRLFDAGA